MRCPSLYSKSIIVFCLLSSSVAFAETFTLNSSGGGSEVDGGLTIKLDPYGSFFSNYANFNPSGDIPTGDTTYESSVFFRSFDSSIATFLSGNYLPEINFTKTSENSVESLFSIDNMDFKLIQSVVNRTDVAGIQVGSALVQQYSITNNNDSLREFSLTRYLDGDLYMADSTLYDKGGASTLDRTMNQQLFEFDSGQDQSDATTLVGIRAIGGSVPNNYFEVNRYYDLKTKITSGGALSNSINGDGADVDLVTDESYDVALALQRDFNISANNELNHTVLYTTVTEFGLGSTGETPIAAIPTDYRTVSWDGHGLNFSQPGGRYDIALSDTQDLRVTLNIFLEGDAASQSLRNIWEDGIESTWNGQYEIVDGINRYPISLDVIWADSEDSADFSVNVHSGDGNVNSLNFYTGNPSGWGFESQGIIAAHEAGHWLGLFDEYNPMNSGDPAYWPLVDANGDILFDWWGLYTGPNGTPLDNWSTLDDLVYQGGLMGENGVIEAWYYQDFLDWLVGESGRNNLVLGQAPTFTYRDGLGIPDSPLEINNPVPEPTTMLLFGAGLAALAAVGRKKRY